MWLPVALAECSHMVKGNLHENAASAEQCQADSKWFHSLLLPVSGSSNSNKFQSFFQTWWAACSGSVKSIR